VDGQSASVGGTIPHAAGGVPWSQKAANLAEHDLLESGLRARLIDQATFELERHEPQFSARTVVSRGQIKALYALLATALAGCA